MQYAVPKILTCYCSISLLPYFVNFIYKLTRIQLLKSQLFCFLVVLDIFCFTYSKHLIQFRCPFSFRKLLALVSTHQQHRLFWLQRSYLPDDLLTTFSRLIEICLPPPSLPPNNTWQKLFLTGFNFVNRLNTRSNYLQGQDTEAEDRGK